MSPADLPAVNACLNGISAIFLGAGYYFIRRKNQIAHRNCMIAAFAASTLFLACYLTYHGYLAWYIHGLTALSPFLKALMEMLNIATGLFALFFGFFAFIVTLVMYKRAKEDGKDANGAKKPEKIPEPPMQRCLGYPGMPPPPPDAPRPMQAN